MPYSTTIPGQGGSQQPLLIPSSSSASPNRQYQHNGGSFPRQTSYNGGGGPNYGAQGGGPSRWENGSGSTSGGSGGGPVSNLSALMKSKGGDMNDLDMGSSPPGAYANSSLSSNPHSGFHPSSYGPNLPFSAIALGISSNQQQPGSYMGNNLNNMGMSISPPHWGSLGSGSFVGSMGQFGTSLNSRDRELEARYVRDFSCCGKKLNGLHELLEHYEEEHANLAPDVRMAAINAAQNSMNSNLQTSQQQQQQQSQQPIPDRNINSYGVQGIPPTPTSLSGNGQHHHQSDVPQPPGMMDIEMDMDEPTQYPSTPNYHPHPSQHQHQHPIQRNIPNNVVGGMASNPWAAAFRPQLTNTSNSSQQPQCVPPSLLSYAPPTPGSIISSTNSNSTGTGSGSVGVGGYLTPEQIQAKAIRKAQKKAERAAREEVSADDPDSEKRFPCPIEGCGKVYKQANGLKYHLTRSINSGHGNVAALGGLAAILGEEHIGIGGQ
ncbi:uncharacterized protein I206_103350 [Kwoniella pini CBS 10737]|uniref:C2H2-type domain-containing protein n=1 Tax=Kwoniella pini CBS 10737 TaxID=1296096 RepID=A0A1B9I9U5_9TREE|nr:uncharacterized protein I206_01644 [Kwoniella pini CBS 10737]OCF52355.1 hypothetical protein I206_01644 [Kwoniella pini CBS 10737]